MFCCNIRSTLFSRWSVCLQKAARDPNVLAIKITLYRVGHNAPVVDALLEAVENGKQVAVLLELKARFDEESNIEWARKLEEYGVHVVYGLLGLKVHCKALLIVRKEGDVIRRYAHLSTGNYNSVTAQLYTDIGMMTCDPDIGADCTDLFNFLTGYSAKSSYRKLLVAPVTMRDRFAQVDRARDRAPEERARRPPHPEDERSGRQEDDPVAVSGVAGRSEGGAAGARHLLSAAGRSAE